MGLSGFSDDRGERKNVLFGRKKKNVMFDDDFELVYITLYIVCALAIKHNI